MSRYKVTNSKSYGVLSGSKWHCHIYDRKDEIEYIGTGISKKEASDNAWDEVWYKKRKQTYNNTESSNDLTSNYSPTSYSLSLESTGIILTIVGMIITGLIFYWAHDLFEESTNMNNNDLSIKAELGPAFGILVMFGSVIGFVACLIAFFAELFRK